MKLLNFSHPLTAKQRTQIETAIGQEIETITDAPVHFSVELPFAEQVVALIEGLSIHPEQWQTEVWLVVPPALNYITGLLLAELHGRMGHFPTILRLRPVQTALTTEYEFAEILNLQAVRELARTRR